MASMTPSSASARATSNAAYANNALILSNEMEQDHVHPENDPWDWTVDDVVHNLCGSRALWEDGRPNASLPDPVVLEITLREQQVDGATLLKDVTGQVLKDEFGIRPLGQRAAIMWAIEKLRNTSHQYLEQSLSQIASQQNLFNEGAFTPITSMGRFLRSPALSMARTIPPVPRFSYTPETEKTFQTLPRSPQRPEHLDERPSVIPVRASEVFVEGADGRKRRKLNLLSSNGAGPSHRDQKQVPGPSEKATNSVINSSEYLVDGHFGYLGKKKFPVDEIFFGHTKFGEPLGNGDDTLPFRPSTPSRGDIEFVGQVPAGLSEYVYRQMFRFFRCVEEEQLERNDRTVVAVYPYKENILRGGRPRSAIVYEVVDDQVHATREDPLQLNSNTPYDDNYDDSNSNEWGFLSHWAAEPTEELPPLGESDSDEDYSPSLIEEIRAEVEEMEAQKNGSLSTAEVLAIIDEVIEELVQDWRLRKLPIRSRKAHSLWKSTRQRNRRNVALFAAKRELARLEERLGKLRQGITDEIWKRAKDVRAQCWSLELTVFQREEELWRLSVMQSNEPPPKDETKAPSQKKARVLPSDEDAEVLDTDSGGESLSGFIDIDEIDITDVKDSSSGVTPSAPHMRAPHSATDPEKDAVDPAEDTLVGAEADDEMDIESPIKSEPHLDNFATPDSHAAKRPRTPASVIDLTFSSDVDTPASKLPINAFSAVPKQFDGAPELASADDIDSWTWTELEDRDDRKRLIMKLLHEMKRQERKRMAAKIEDTAKGDFIDLLMRAFNALKHSRTKIPGVPGSAFLQLTRFAALYVCWANCRKKYWRDHIDVAVIDSLLEELKEDKTNLEEFYKFVRQILIKFARPAATTPGRDSNKGISSSNPVILGDSLAVKSLMNERDGSDSSLDEEIAANTPSKRKRKVEKNAAAAQKRQEAYTRMVNERRQRMLYAQLGPEYFGTGNSDRNILVNTSNDSGEGDIYIHPHIASRIKKHQIEGIQFMWREIITGGQSEDEMPGCLLAHTMGLGKTMQAITLIVTIAEAIHSEDPAVRKQIPPDLQKAPFRVLIMCPAGLINNWRIELGEWIPADVLRIIGEVHCLTAETISVDERVQTLANWDRNGGILVIGHELFRICVANKGGRTTSFSPADHERIMKYLLKGPQIVIVDEAHILKNANSQVSLAADKFKTKRRIALTGSPLNNNLLEYFAMINWIARGYLGDLVEFKAHYQEPIEQGLYADSLPYEKRLALKKLRVLKDEIEPKVNRADITALKGQLKPKVEFILTVPLTKVQEEAYTVYARSLLSNSKKEVGNATLWSWLFLLQLLCNHPILFLNKLRQRQKESLKKASQSGSGSATPRVHKPDWDIAYMEEDDSGDPLWPDDCDISETVLAQSMIESQELLFKQVKDLESPMHSYKMSVLLQILNLSKKAGDRVLVFSQSIPTLNYIEAFCRKQRRPYIRIDGKVKPGSRQQTAKSFNEEGSFDLALISTKAGGLGLNIPGANRVVIFDFQWNPAWEEQAVGRAYRMGQQKPVFVYHLLAGGTFEKKVKNKTNFKTQLAITVVDKKNVKTHAVKSREFLSDPEAVDQEDLEIYKGNDPQVLDKILETCSDDEPFYIRSIMTTETLKVEEKENFTAEEQMEIENMRKEENLKRTNPLKYRELLLRRQLPHIPVPLSMHMPPPASTAPPVPRPPPVFVDLSSDSDQPPASSLPVTRAAEPSGSGVLAGEAVPAEATAEDSSTRVERAETEPVRKSSFFENLTKKFMGGGSASPPRGSSS